MAKINDIDFTSVFNGSPFQTIVWAADDPTFTILAQNDRHAATTLNGAPKKIGSPLMEAYPDTSEQYLKTGVSTLVESIRTTIKTKKMDTMPIIRYDIKDGNGVFIERYWQASHYPLFDAHNNVYAVFQVTEDITKSMKTDKELDRVNIQLENALNLARIGTWQWHIPTGHVTADKTVAKMFGISPKVAAAGLPVDTFIASIHPSDRPEALRAIDRTVKNHEPYNHEYRTVSTNGSVRWTNARGQVELDSAGNALNFPGVIIDITETKQAALIAAFLAKASAQLASSLDYVQNVKILGDIAVPEIVDWIAIKRLDEGGQLKQLVVKHCDDTKTAWAERNGSVNGPIADRAIRTRQQQFYPDLAHAPASVKKEISHELDLRSLCISPIMVNGQAVGTLSIGLSGDERLFTDADSYLGSELAARVSLAIANATLYDLATDELGKREVLQAELKQANERLEKRVLERTAELNSTNLNLQRSNQELQDFAYVASHDLQEPLRKIQAFGNLLQDEYASELGEGSDYLNRMRSAAARMSILIEDLLSFSRVTTDAKPFTSVNLNEVLSEVLEDLENRIDTTGGSVESEDLPTINADHTQIRQLLQNLVGNALKFHKVDTPPIVKVACQVLPNTIELTVTDNGVGFDEKYLDRIFAVFQRLHGRDVYEGTGIGLAVCRKIVERHGGSITATSQLDNGASFIVSLAK
ncbi:PAS domain-containing protein [Candidatus Saccharibacteria bacterium]|nr:PAS domain-containing protein [Candidatus Saccharibacteria bacterium]